MSVVETSDLLWSSAVVQPCQRCGNDVEIRIEPHCGVCDVSMVVSTDGQRAHCPSCLTRLYDIQAHEAGWRRAGSAVIRSSEHGIWVTVNFTLVQPDDARDLARALLKAARAVEKRAPRFTYERRTGAMQQTALF